MQRQVLITADPIDEASLGAQRRASPGTGAVVHFTGLVRGTERGEPISALDYESFARMAEHQIDLLLDQAEQRWPIESVRLVHRIGVVNVGQPSIWVEVVASHRGEAFAACQWLLDEMKRVAPIWKKPIPSQS